MVKIFSFEEGFYFRLRTVKMAKDKTTLKKDKFFFKKTKVELKLKFISIFSNKMSINLSVSFYKIQKNKNIYSYSFSLNWPTGPIQS